MARRPLFAAVPWLYDAGVLDARTSFDEYAAATAAHDLVGTLRMVNDDAVYWFSDDRSHVGKRAIEAVLQENFAAIGDETYTIDDHRWIVQSNDVAVCLYRYLWRGVIDGVEASGSGRGTTVLSRATDTTWQVVHEHLSSGPTGL